MSKVNKYITLTTDSPSLPKFKKEYLNQHSRFIHTSWLLKEDIDREVEMNNIKYTVFGLWEIIGSDWIIMLKPVEGGPFFLANSKEVSRAMGYSKMRNAVTGKEHTFDYAYNGYNAITPVGIASIAESDEDDEDIVDEHDEDDNEIDPLVKALQDELIDDGDTSNY